jgi:hypothetical protein
MREPLSLQHQAAINQALGSFTRGEGAHCLSDYSFANFYLFRHAHCYEFQSGDWPCLHGVAYDGQAYVLPLFDVCQAPHSVVHNFLQDKQTVLFPLAKEQLDHFSADNFAWHAAEADADYVYPADNFRHYTGSMLNKKRNLVRQLLDSVEVTATAYATDMAKEAQTVLADWMRAKGKQTGDADEQPCLEALQHADRLGLHGFTFHVKQAPAGFVLAETLAPGVWVMRFAKGMDHLKGIYQFMFQYVCQATPALQWLNFEQDLGLPNLRQTKLSYQPDLLLPKYRVRLSQLAHHSLPAST